MRLTAVGFGISALLATGVAFAAPQGGAAGSKANEGGKAGIGPDTSTAAGAGGSAEQGGSIDTTLRPYGGKSTMNPDETTGAKPEEKPWEVSGTFETHRLVRQEYVAEGLGPVKTFNVLFATAKYSLTDNDILILAGGGYQFFMADSGESGLRASDLSLSYSRIVPLPEKFVLQATGTLTAPISYDSQLASNITTPSLMVGLSRRFGDLLVSFNVSGRYSWDRYTTANAIGQGTSGPDSGAGQTNSKWGLGGALAAEYSMPFHRPWSIGAAVTDQYVWFYNVGQGPASSTFYGATTYPNIDNQPFQQSYGGEIFTRYILPDVGGFKSDLTFAFANGDPSLGYPAVLHDGVVHPYLYYYNNTEAYFALEGRY